LKIKVIQGIFKQNIKPKCQIKWEEQYGSQISFIVRKLLCRNEVNPNGLFLKVIEELQNILVFRME
jgi:hypothetical protein